MKLWLIAAYLLFALQQYKQKSQNLAVMLFMWLSRQTSFKNLVKPWREITDLKKIKKSDLSKKIIIFSNTGYFPTKCLQCKILHTDYFVHFYTRSKHTMPYIILGEWWCSFWMQVFSLIAAHHLEVVGHYCCNRISGDISHAECQKGERTP